MIAGVCVARSAFKATETMQGLHEVAKEQVEVLANRLEKRLAQLQAEAQITAKVPNLKGGALVIPAGLLLASHSRSTR